MQMDRIMAKCDDEDALGGVVVELGCVRAAMAKKAIMPYNLKIYLVVALAVVVVMVAVKVAVVRVMKHAFWINH